MTIILLLCFQLWADIFRFHVIAEPTTLDPSSTKLNSSHYFLNALHRRLTKIDTNNNLMYDLAEFCSYSSPKVLKCKLKKEFYSDGSPIKSQDFQRSFQNILSKKSLVSEILFTIKNAKDIFLGNKSSSELGIETPDESNITFILQEEDSDFLLKLASSQLVPLKSLTIPKISQANTFVTSGPYQIKEWIQQDRIKLKANSYFNNKKLPEAEILFIKEDTTALNLYEKGELSFLRRLPTLHIKKYQNSKEFKFYPQARFDYIGFGPELKENLELRKALADSPDYQSLQKLLNSLGPPGCPSIPENWHTKATCLGQKIDADFKNQKLIFAYNSQGGDDFKATMEWFQFQWKDKIKLSIQLKPQENKIYLNTLAKAPPALFRKGVNLSRPSCLAAIEIFESSNPENYIHLNSKLYDENLSKLRKTTDEKQKKSLCQNGLDFLIKNYYIIPLGRIHFATLLKSRYKNLEINEMNQIDFSKLEEVQTNKL